MVKVDFKEKLNQIVLSAKESTMKTTPGIYRDTHRMNTSNSGIPIFFIITIYIC
jgi:hypothetical protein